MSKNTLREEFLSRWRAVESAELVFASKRIGENVDLLFQKLSIHCSDIGAYVSISQEVDSSFLIEKCLQLNGSVCLPVLEGGTMFFRKVFANSWHEIEKTLVVAPGFTCLRQPEAGAKVSPDIIFVPGLAFSCGFRLGRGGGYYDRLFQYTSPIKVGISLSSFLNEDKSWVEPHDIRMDYIVHEGGIIDYNSALGC